MNIVELVERGHLVPPTLATIAKNSTGKILFKSLAILQTLWVILQHIYRCAVGLPVTQLEATILAYAVFTVAMNIAW